MQKKILVSGFVLDNFLEISSFLEKNQIKRAKIEKKILHMLNTIVPSGELIHLAQGYKIQKMYHCLLQDFDKEAKEKECFISDRNLIYIAEDWIQLDQNILFILFYESPVEVLKQKACLNDKFYINDILNSWLKYNTFLLDFYKKNRERSILINYKDFDVALCKYLNEKYYFNMVKIYKENSSIKSKNLFDFLLEYMLNSNEKCLNCYKGLEGYSLNPNFNSNDLPFKNLESEIINLFQILKISEILSIKNKSLLDFIFEMQEYIEKLYYQHGNCLKEITFKKSQTIETKNKTIQNKDDLLNFQAQYGTA
ncbi:hypothetical protein E5Z00_08885, partial [Campylobacter coli]